MKVCVIQPPYSTRFEDRFACFEKFTELMDACDDTLDIIVLPEYSDTPTVVHNQEEFLEELASFHDLIMEKAKALAVRCNAVVFVNAVHDPGEGLRNTTHAINQKGEVVGRYYKAHPAPVEFKTLEEGGRGMDASYCYEYSKPYTVEIDGLRYGFMTCYDFYFYESYAALARENVDIIIGCSHQRSDLHRALEVNASFLCYQTNAYLLRSSVSLGAESPTGGCSLICAPDGELLASMKNEVGLCIREIDPRKKYFKPAGFGRPLAAHYQYIEEGRHPQNYRPGGSAIVTQDERMPYPRVCAHRGYNTVAPENTLPAYGAAVALGAEEIEFDLWWTKDRQLVSTHDKRLERVSDGSGMVIDHTLEELRRLDFGAKAGEGFHGLRIATFEDILRKFSCHAIMNIHIKTLNNTDPYPEDMLEKIIGLIRKYDCAKHVYFMSGNDTLLAQLRAAAPDIVCCCGGGSAPWEIVDRAIALGCKKVQLFKPYFNQEMINKAHEHGIICNVFFADDIDEAKKYLDMGIDTILTNDYKRISSILQK
jgi:glycerophosphoryl diester phosphodiesterase/predicted amidohydrolase